MRSEGSAIGEEGNGSEDFRDLGFSRTFESEGRENERMLEFEVEVGKKILQPLQFNQTLLGLMIISLNS